MFCTCTRAHTHTMISWGGASVSVEHVCHMRPRSPKRDDSMTLWVHTDSREDAVHLEPPSAFYCSDEVMGPWCNNPPPHTHTHTSDLHLFTFIHQKRFDLSCTSIFLFGPEEFHEQILQPGNVWTRRPQRWSMQRHMDHFFYDLDIFLYFDIYNLLNV